jgi:hypothetical protein
LPTELTYLKGMVSRALAATAALWPPIRVAFGWVHRAAHILGREEASGESIRRQLGGLLGAMTAHRASAGSLAAGVDHFGKVSRSYWAGLFACYDTADLPRTNNDLEQAFGSHRYHERRASGRKGASPSLVLRGSVKLVAGLATRRQEVTAEQLSGVDPEAWRAKRAELDDRRERRTDRRRFRRDPDAYLRDLEIKLHQSRLRA